MKTRGKNRVSRSSRDAPSPRAIERAADALGIVVLPIIPIAFLARVAIHRLLVVRVHGGGRLGRGLTVRGELGWGRGKMLPGDIVLINKGDNASVQVR